MGVGLIEILNHFEWSGGWGTY